MAGGLIQISPGAPKGNQHAYKHGRYTAEAIENRRELSAMLLAMKTMARMVIIE
ncbi:MAG: hypothetical protein Q7T45_06245 [Bradyrhizobium sp.]|uniref:hypothetical protein n=1 Tax=Bradyrhizobium sp. TaxID=376 RepID=UPI0027192A1B|nr:hypothetical protein [Bradyrhizobium sp.]MDO8397402.1 hypothetical protein [Bradyrhizobium sp.]